MDNWRVVDEEAVKDSSDILGEGNTLEEILKSGEAFKEAGLTPIYLHDPTTSKIKVIAEELIGVLLN